MCGAHDGQAVTVWPEKSMIAEGSYPSGRRFWVTLPGKPATPPEITDEDAGNLEWKVEEGEDEYQLWSCD